MDKPGRKNLKAKRKSVMNSWMENETLVAEAVDAVRAGRSLSWNRIFRHGGSTWNDYKRASAWVLRERRKKEARAMGDASEPRFSSKAAIALRETDSANIAEKTQTKEDICAHPDVVNVDTKPLEDNVGDWINGAAFQFVGLLILIPLGILLGFQYGGGLIAGIILPLTFALGIIILIFRFIGAAATSVKSRRPIPKDWYK